MSEVAMGTILLFVSLAVLMLVRIPIAFSLSISALITAWGSRILTCSRRCPSA